MNLECEGVSPLRVNSIGFLVSIFCFVFAIYLAGLSFRVDVPLRVQLLALATSFFVAGIIVLIFFGMSLGLKKAFKF